MNIENAYRDTGDSIMAYNNCVVGQVRTGNAKMSSSRHQLAPNAKCAVCSDDASGYHYGVDSCEGCKGFFRRCITQGINFRCSNEEKCQITPFTRNSCQYCRLKKCFQVGMSREASRLGRRPKKVMKSSNLSRDIQAQLTKHIDTKPQTPNSSTMDYPDLANVALSDFFGLSPAMMSKFESMMPAVAGSMSGLASAAGVEVGSFPFSPATSQSVNKAAMMAQFAGQDSSSPLNLSDSQTKYPQELVKTPTENVTHMDLSKWRKKQFEVMSKYMHNKDSGSVEDRTASETSSINSPNASGQSKDNSPLSFTLSPGECAMAEEDAPQKPDFTIFSDAQHQRLQRFMHYISLDKEDDMIELIGQVQTGIMSSHLERCYHQRPRINALSAELDVREQSGENVKPPSGFWSHWMAEMLPAIERVIRFLKDTPGFRELPINDQILLIKRGAFDIVLSQAMPMVDPDKRTMLDPQLKYRNSREDFESMPEPFKNLFDDLFVLAKEFKMTGITDVETGLINAILGVNSDVEGFENATGVKKLECLFVQTLYDYVIKTYPDEPHRFESLIRLIPLVDNSSQAHANSLHKIKCTVPTGGQSFPPLHDEIFS